VREGVRVWFQGAGEASRRRSRPTSRWSWPP